MSGTRPDPERQVAAPRSGRRSRREGSAQAGRATGEDEILRTRHGMPGRGGSPPERREGPSVGPRGAEHSPHRDRGAAASAAGDGPRGEWLPSGVLLTSGEALAAVLVAGACWPSAAVLFALAERSAELSEPIAGHGFVASLLFGLACGLYVSLRLRGRRLAWRKQLEGKR